MSSSGWAAEVVATLTAPDCRCVGVAPDGSAVAVVAAGAVALREVRGPLVWSTALDVPGDEAVELAWSRRGDRLYLLADRRLHALDADTGDFRDLPDELAGRHDLTALAVSTDDRMLAVGASDGRVLVLDRDTGTVTVYPTGDRVTALAWRPGELELCVAQPRALHFWSMTAMGLLRTVGSGNLYAHRLAWSPDTRLIAAAGARDVLMVDAQSRRALDLLDVGRADPPVALGFTRDGTHLLVGFADGVEVVDRQLVAVHRLPADLVAAATLQVGVSGLAAARVDPGHVRVWRFPDTEAAPSGSRSRTSVRRWAARAARTLGRARVAVGDRAVAARPSVLVEPDGDRWGPGFAWAPGGGSYYLESAPGRLRRVRTADPAGEVLWEGSVEEVPGGVLDVEVSAGAGRMVVLAFRNIGSARPPVRVVDAATGEAITRLAGGQSPAWHPREEGTLAVPVPGERPDGVLVYRSVEPGNPSAVGEPERLAAREGVGRLGWSPDGRLLAAACRGRIVLWDTDGWRRVAGPVAEDDRVVFGRLAWSPDGHHLAAAPVGPGAPVVVWAAATWQRHRVLSPTSGPGWAPALAWSPGGSMLAFPGAESGAVELWDTTAGRRIRTLPPPEHPSGPVWTVRWAPEGDELVTSYAGGLVLRWRLQPTAPAGSTAPTRPLPFDVGTICSLGVAAAQVGIAASLSLLTDLLALLCDRTPNALRALAGHRGVTALRSLRWPVAAVVGVVTLLAAELPTDERYPPPDPTEAPDADELTAALDRALAGSAVAADQPAAPLPALTAALDDVDDRLLTLLTLLGADSVAADPTLPTRLRQLRQDLWALGPDQRRLLHLRLPLSSGGTAQGGGTGGARAGIARHGHVNALLPSQLAAPELLTVRHSRDELLYRTREGTPPPAPRATVIVLDDTPAAHGQVGITLRCTAHLLARTLLERHHRCALVTLGEPPAASFLDQHTDLARVWTANSVYPADPPSAFRLVSATATQLADPVTGAPRVVLLSHPYLPAPAYPDLTTVRVHYPGQPVTATAPRTHGLPATPTAEELSAVVAALLAEV